MTKKEYIYIFMLIVLILMIGGFYSYIKNNDIKENKVFTCGNISDYAKTSRGARMIIYEYYDKGIKYEGGTGTGYFEDCDKTGWCIGKCFEVQYSSKHPENSFMDFDKPCDCPKELDTTKTGQY